MFQLKLSEVGFRSMIFLDWLVKIFLNCWIAHLCLQREDRLLLTQNKLRDAGLSICNDWFNLVILCHSLYVNCDYRIFRSKLRQVVLHYGHNLVPSLLTDSLKNLDNAAVERVIIKCDHTTVFAEMIYITYTNNVWRSEKAKSHRRPNILHLNMSH